MKNQPSALSPQPDLYQFPATRFTRNNLWQQWWHLLGEVLEIGADLWLGRLQNAAAETWDVKHSAETLHRIMSGQGADVALAKDAVKITNEKRGYYGN